MDGDRPVGTVDLAEDPAPVAGSFVGVRLFSGYAGWDSGQLEAEIEDGSWYVVPAEARRSHLGRPREPVAAGPAPPGRRPGPGVGIPRGPGHELSGARRLPSAVDATGTGRPDGAPGGGRRRAGPDRHAGAGLRRRPGGQLHVRRGPPTASGGSTPSSPPSSGTSTFPTGTSTPPTSVDGAALWGPPDAARNGLRELLQLLPAAPFLVSTRTHRALRLLFEVDGLRPKEPHWYLATLGTEPSPAGQGRGLGPPATRCSSASTSRGRPAYLESSKERNVPVLRPVRLRGGRGARPQGGQPDHLAHVARAPGPRDLG